MGFTIIVDGPNFINRLEDHGKDQNYIMNTFSFPILQSIVQEKLRQNGLASHPFYHTEFIYSNKERIGDFVGEERKQLLKKLQHERGVVVREVPLSTGEGREKAVDMTVFSRMLTMGDANSWRHIVLIAADKDYVPAIEALITKGIHVILLAFADTCPIELINESYLFLDLSELLTEMELRIQPEI